MRNGANARPLESFEAYPRYSPKREKRISIGYGHRVIELALLQLEAGQDGEEHTWEVKIEGAKHISATVDVAVKS